MYRYGLVYPGIGWILFRSKDYLPESLVRALVPLSVQGFIIFYPYDPQF